ncbi:antitoxin, partial [Embleya sp. NPDC059267]|uniref:antitoxin n=1 Tax=Embleya sp. NPDC059267 TaxID=3346798 RepID=UPI00368D0A2C
MSVFDWFKRRPSTAQESGSCCSQNPAGPDTATLVEDRPATQPSADAEAEPVEAAATTPAPRTPGDAAAAQVAAGASEKEQDMGVFDNIKAKAEGLLGQHGDKADKGIDKAAEMADRKTGGKHSDKIRGASDKAKEALDRKAGGDAPEATPPAPPADPPA